jgi:hypothetical protein
MQSVESFSLYDRPEALPEGLTGELLNGPLYAQPRSAGVRRNPCYRSRSAGFSTAEGEAPAAGWILVEAEIHFAHDTEVRVPDPARSGGSLPRSSITLFFRNFHITQKA